MFDQVIFGRVFPQLLCCIQLDNPIKFDGVIFMRNFRAVSKDMTLFLATEIKAPRP